jgi:hypothetical protein
MKKEDKILERIIHLKNLPPIRANVVWHTDGEKRNGRYPLIFELWEVLPEGVEVISTNTPYWLWLIYYPSIIPHPTEPDSFHKLEQPESRIFEYVDGGRPMNPNRIDMLELLIELGYDFMKLYPEPDIVDEEEEED